MARLLACGIVLLIATLAPSAQAPGRGQPRTPNPGPRIPNPESRVPSSGFSVVEASIDQMRLAMEQGRATARDIVTQSLVRIATYEDRLNAAITINPQRARGGGCARPRAEAGRIRGPLHGIPIALKDNIHTTDMPTTGGALAFDGCWPPYEATIDEEAAGCRRDHHREDGDDGARELGGRRATMPTNYSSLAGYGFNPYDPRRDPREASTTDVRRCATGGSSSGIGTPAASGRRTSAPRPRARS